MNHSVAQILTVVTMAAVLWLVIRSWRRSAIEAVQEYWRVNELHYEMSGRVRFFMGYPAYLYVVIIDDGRLYECKYELRPGYFQRKRINNYHWGKVLPRYKTPV